MEMLLGIILSIFIGFWILGLLGRVFLRYWLLKKQRQMEQQMRDGGYSGTNGEPFFGTFGKGGFRGFYSSQSASGGSSSRASNKQEGEVTVDKTANTNTHSVNKKIGEYVDFEDVKES